MICHHPGRRLRNKTVRQMVTWSFYKFKQRLLNKCKEYNNCYVQIVDEAYTTKTCGLCGYQNDEIGGSKIVECPKCNVSFDRDMNGARNILLRYLSIQHGLLPPSVSASKNTNILDISKI
jgi:putative transposase